MAKSSGPLIVVAGAAALLLMGGKKKKKSPSSGGGDSGVTDDGGSSGGDPYNGSGSSGGGSGGGSSSGDGSSSGGSSGDSARAKSAGGIWVSSDCKKVEYEGGDPEAWWLRRGKSAAQNFIDANYHDPYEIARAIIVQLAPCAVEFPIMEDDFEPMEEEYKREQFLRSFKDVYYLIQWLYDAISELLDSESYTVEFDDRCDFVFMGDNWLNTTAERMIQFYLGYSYPIDSDEDFNVKAWEGADVDEKNAEWFDNIALAVINRMHPECAWQILDAFVKDPKAAKGFFGTRPGMKAAYDRIVAAVHSLDDDRMANSGMTFEPMS